jgi:hypothetical protein
MADVLPIGVDLDAEVQSWVPCSAPGDPGRPPLRVYEPTLRKTYFEMSKNYGGKIPMCIESFYVCTQWFIEKTIFVTLRANIK